MRIVFIPSWYPEEKNPLNGIFIHEQAVFLHQQGHEVFVLYQRMVSIKEYLKGQRKGSIRKQAVCIDGVEVRRVFGLNYFPKLKNLQKRLYISRYIALYKKIISEFGQADIIHCHVTYPAGIGAVGLRKKFQVPLIITEHSSSFIKGTISRYRKSVIQNIFAHMDRLVVVSNFLKIKILENYQIPEKSATTISNMVDTDFFTMLKPLRERSNDSRFKFFALGALTRGKGIYDLIEAFSLMSEKKAILAIGGDGPERKTLEQRCFDTGIADRVTCLGRISRESTAQQMNQCDVFIMPSHYETFSVVLIEALACGVPVISTASGGPDDIVTEKNGILVPVGDTASLAEAMSTMINSFETYDRKEIREDCIKRFGKVAVSEKIYALYQELAAHKIG